MAGFTTTEIDDVAAVSQAALDEAKARRERLHAQASS
jgi:hypothetical protein